MRPRTLLLPALVVLIAVASIDALLSRVGPRHFLPQQKMETALAAGYGCILLLGDSRMDAAHSALSLHEALSAHSADSCAADLSIGATDISGAYLAARQYLQRGGRPRLIVLGEVADSLLDPSAPLDPQQMVGNNVIHLTWSRSSDVSLEFPGFPARSIDAFDAGFRFLAARATSIGRFQSLLWLRVQKLQNRFVGKPVAASDRFGRLTDMDRLEEGLRRKAVARMAQALDGPSPLASERWLTRLVDLLKDARIPITIVELPMREAYRHAVTETPTALAYKRRTAERVTGWGGNFIDLGRPDWLDDSYFADALHLNENGARRFSRDLGERLAIVAP